MTAPEDPLLFIAYAPALVRDDGRLLAVTHAMERALPGLRLAWAISDEGKFIALPRRDEWIAEAASRRNFPMLCNGDEGSLVTLTGWERPAGISPGGQAQFEVHAEAPLGLTGFGAAPAVLEGIAEGASSFWGHVTPRRAARDIAEQTSRPLHGPHLPPRGLPVLKKSEEFRSPDVPHRLGWVNYWSAATARRLGFPDPARDADLLSRARRTATGGWVVQLTEAPLDLDNPAHLDALLRAYERFPEIGGRSSP